MILLFWSQDWLRGRRGNQSEPITTVHSLGYRDWSIKGHVIEIGPESHLKNRDRKARFLLYIGAGTVRSWTCWVLPLPPEKNEQENGWELTENSLFTPLLAVPRFTYSTVCSILIATPVSFQQISPLLFSSGLSWVSVICNRRGLIHILFKLKSEILIA